MLNKILTIVGREDTPQVGSLLPVGLSTISDEHTTTTRICVINAIIGLNDLVFGALCLAGVVYASELPNDTPVDNCLAPANQNFVIISKNIGKMLKL